MVEVGINVNLIDENYIKKRESGFARKRS